MMDLLLWHDAQHWWGGGIVFLLLALILVFLVVKFWLFRGWWGPRGGWMSRDWPDTSPETVLKRRLASGEISEADYHRLRDVLRE